MGQEACALVPSGAGVPPFWSSLSFGMFVPNGLPFLHAINNRTRTIMDKGNPTV